MMDDAFAHFEGPLQKEWNVRHYYRCNDIVRKTCTFSKLYFRREAMMLVTACSHVPPDFPSFVAIPKRITATASETQPVPLRTYLEPPMMGGGDRTKTLMIEEWIQDVTIVTFRLATHLSSDYYYYYAIL